MFYYIYLYTLANFTDINKTEYTEVSRKFTVFKKQAWTFVVLHSAFIKRQWHEPCKPWQTVLYVFFIKSNFNGLNLKLLNNLMRWTQLMHIDYRKPKGQKLFKILYFEVHTVSNCVEKKNISPCDMHRYNVGCF